MKPKIEKATFSGEKVEFCLNLHSCRKNIHAGYSSSCDSDQSITADGLLTFLGLMPHDALQIDAGSRLTGTQTGRVPLQGSWDASVLRVGAYGASPHHQLLGVGGGQGRRGETRSRGQRGSRGSRVTWSWGGRHCEHGLHLEAEHKQRKDVSRCTTPVSRRPKNMLMTWFHSPKCHSLHYCHHSLQPPIPSIEAADNHPSNTSVPVFAFSPPQWVRTVESQTEMQQRQRPNICFCCFLSFVFIKTLKSATFYYKTASSEHKATWLELIYSNQDNSCTVDSLDGGSYLNRLRQTATEKCAWLFLL